MNTAFSQTCSDMYGHFLRKFEFEASYTMLTTDLYL